MAYGCDIIASDYYCCNLTKKQNTFEACQEFIESSLEVGSLIKKLREIDIITKLIINKDQKSCLILPSININSEKSFIMNKTEEDDDDSIEARMESEEPNECINSMLVLANWIINEGRIES